MKFTVSIGIPAYNEEANIKQLLEALLIQKEDDFILKEIIVVSDGSTDKTVECASSIGDSRIKVIDEKIRKGGTLTQNEVLRVANGDILVLLNADILPKDNMFVTNIIAPFYETRERKIGIVSAKPIPIRATGFIDTVLNFSFGFKEYMYVHINNGDNVYLCRGVARAFSRDFYKALIWDNTTSEDGFSYLSCQIAGFQFVYAPKAIIHFKSPVNFRDHIKQSTRFFRGNIDLEIFFGKDFVRESFRIPKGIMIKSCVKYFFRNPILFTSYIVILAITKTKSLFVTKKLNPMWETVVSTKKLEIRL